MNLHCRVTRVLVQKQPNILVDVLRNSNVMMYCRGDGYWHSLAMPELIQLSRILKLGADPWQVHFAMFDLGKLLYKFMLICSVVSGLGFLMF